MKTGVTWVIASVVGLVLAACGPAATAMPRPAATATPRPAATATPRPAATATPRPAATLVPTIAPTPTAVGATRGGVIRWPLTTDPPTWDPVNRITQNIYTKGSVFSRLFSLRADPPQACKYELTPRLVKEWRWIDDRTAEFSIQQGVKFHNKPPVNGREVTAQDVAFSLMEWRRETLIGPTVGLAEPEAVGKYTFRMKASSPWGGMVMEILGHDYGPMVLAQEAGGPKGEFWADPQKSWIGSGAFTFELWQPGVKWGLARNPNYWKSGSPLADGIEFWVVPDLSTQMAAMRSGKINLSDNWGEVQVQDIEKTLPGVKTVRCPTAGSSPGALYMNTQGPPFNDVRVRRAVFMAMDRQAIANGPHQGKAVIAPVLRPGLPYALTVEDLPPEVRQYMEHHPDKARQLLAEAGYPNGFDTVLNSTGAINRQSFQAVWESAVNMLDQVGIRAKLNNMEWGRYVATAISAKYPVGEMVASPVGQRTLEEGHSLANPTKYAGAVNRSLVSDAEYTQMFEEFRSTTAEARRGELARKLQIRQVDQAYRVVMPFPYDTLVARPELRGFEGFASSEDPSPVLERVWIAR